MAENKKETEFNLSKKGIIDENMNGEFTYRETDIKEFIRLLKSKTKFCCPYCKNYIMNSLNRFAGDKLK